MLILQKKVKLMNNDFLVLKMYKYSSDLRSYMYLQKKFNGDMEHVL